MADSVVPEEETPAQRQARLRRQKREAKITSNATERLDKITKLSGRAPEHMRTSPPTFTPPVIRTPERISTPTPAPQAFPGFSENADEAQQQEFLRALLRAAPPQATGIPAQGQAQAQAPEMEDPMMKMLSSMLGGMDPSGNPDMFGGGGGGGLGGLPFSPDDISKATGLPSFVTNLMMGKQKTPPTPQEIRSNRLWKLLHVIFAVLAGIYLMFSVDQAVNKFGSKPPAPATFQNPFILFVTGELVIQATRIMTAGTSGKSGVGLWIQMLKEFAGDGAIMVFMLGVATWWEGMA